MEAISAAGSHEPTLRTLSLLLTRVRSWSSPPAAAGAFAYSRLNVTGRRVEFSLTRVAGSGCDTPQLYGSHSPSLHPDMAHPCHIRTATGLTRCHIRSGTGLTP